MMYYVLLRPEQKAEKEKRLENGPPGFRTGYLFEGEPPEGWAKVEEHSTPGISAYEKIGDNRNNLRLVSFELEVMQYRK